VGQVLPIYLLALLGMVVFYIYPTQIPFYLQAFKLSPARVSLYLALTTLMGALASLSCAQTFLTKPSVRSRWA